MGTKRGIAGEISWSSCSGLSGMPQTPYVGRVEGAQGQGARRKVQLCGVAAIGQKGKQALIGAKFHLTKTAHTSQERDCFHLPVTGRKTGEEGTCPRSQSMWL